MKTRRDFLRLSGLAATAVCSGCAAGNSGAGSWTSSEIEMLDANARRNGGQGWAAWQGGRQITATNSDTRGPALSITKSIAALAVTRAVGEGWLSPSEHVADTITEWHGDPLKSRITVLMLLQQSSGLEAGVIPLYRNHPPDKGSAAVALRCVDSPGSVFRYGPGHWEVLAEVLKRKLSPKHESLGAFMSRSVMQPVGLSRGHWRADKMDVPYLSTGTELNVKELGRLGKTIGNLLNGKNSDGLKASDYAEVTRPSAANPMFGGGLWRNSNVRHSGTVAIEVERSINGPLSSAYWSHACLSTKQPADFVTLIGSGGRRVYIWPAGEKRIARQGSSASWSDLAFLAKV